MNSTSDTVADPESVTDDRSHAPGVDKTCRNPSCDSRAWWGGWCRLCWQVTGAGDRASEKRRADEDAERAAKIEGERQRTRDRLVELGDAGQLPWWEISEQLNAAGLRLDGRPFTPASARGAYVTFTVDRWE